MDWKEVGAAVAALVVGAGAIAHRYRRTNSREKVESAKDEAEVRIISRLEEERNEAREEAERERQQRMRDTQRLARLEAENAYLKSYARRLIRALPARDRQVYETDFSPFVDTPECPVPPPAPEVKP
jgi:membrane protein involved in colicin uptake